MIEKCDPFLLSVNEDWEVIGKRLESDWEEIGK
jgi:hypothetical protein